MPSVVQSLPARFVDLPVLLVSHPSALTSRRSPSRDPENLWTCNMSILVSVRARSSPVDPTAGRRDFSAFFVRTSRIHRSSRCSPDTSLNNDNLHLHGAGNLSMAHGRRAKGSTGSRSPLFAAQQRAESAIGPLNIICDDFRFLPVLTLRKGPFQRPKPACP